MLKVNNMKYEVQFKLNVDRRLDAVRKAKIKEIFNDYSEEKYKNYMVFMQQNMRNIILEDGGILIHSSIEKLKEQYLEILSILQIDSSQLNDNINISISADIVKEENFLPYEQLQCLLKALEIEKNIMFTEVSYLQKIHNSIIVEMELKVELEGLNVKMSLRSNKEKFWENFDLLKGYLEEEFLSKINKKEEIQNGSC